MKLLEDDYVKPEFPPSLEWYDVHRGMEHAGELLATFELLQVLLVHFIRRARHPRLTRFAFRLPRKQLPNALIGECTVLPRLPDPKDVYSIIDGQHHEPILPIPKDIRPTLAKYRCE